MKTRSIQTSVQENASKYPVLAITGPRQSGKTTFLKTLFKGYRYLTLENPDTRTYATEDTRNFLNEFDDKIIFDEAQRVPQLFSYLQGIVDDNQVMGQFVVSGSQNFNLMESITQTLAGRIALFKLFPFDITEMREADWLKDNLKEIMTYGFYPAIFQRGMNPDRYYSDYINTYLKRDISQLVNIQNDRAFNSFLKLCATRAGQLVNFNDLARDTGVSHTTIRNWLSLLETSYVVYFLPPYHNNFSKRVMKSPKLYFYDVGLLCHLLNVRKSNITPTHRLWGSIFENMVVSDFIKQSYHNDELRDFYFWRDSHGNEIDLLYMENDALHSIEIKASSTIKSNMFKGLNYIRKIAGEEVNHIQTLVYGGAEVQHRTNYTAIPYNQISLEGNLN